MRKFYKYNNVLNPNFNLYTLRIELFYDENDNLILVTLINYKNSLTIPINLFFKICKKVLEKIRSYKKNKRFKF